MNKQKGLAPVLIIILIALAVGGYLLYQKSRLNPVSIPVIQQNPQPSSSSVDEMSNWKTYTDKVSGFSIKYPSDWIYKQISYQSVGSNDTAPSFVGTGFLPSDPKPVNNSYATINIRIFNNPDKLSLGELVKNWYSSSNNKQGELPAAIKSGQDINVGGVQGKKVVNPPIDTAGLPITWILLSKDEKVFLFAITLDKSYPGIDKEQVFNLMLATFKFQ